jgi:hypothetical protein
MRLTMTRGLGLALAMLAVSATAKAETLMCKVNEAFQLAESGRLESNERLAQVWKEAFYIDAETGKVTGGPMSTEGWGEIKVYPVPKYHSLTIVSFTHRQDTKRGLRTLYVGERSKSNTHAFQIADALFVYAGACELH